MSTAAQSIVIVDYGTGNLGSITNMLRYVGSDGVISSDPGEIAAADKLILPGVGAFDEGMSQLAELELVELLNDLVLEKHTPILGICLGCQLLTRSSEEGERPGFGWLDADTKRFSFEPGQNRLKVPHMGWNGVQTCGSHTLFEDMPPDPRFYFVHSYHLDCDNESDVLAWAVHGYRFAAAAGRDNIVGVQFHPEKSLRFGIRLLENFVEKV